uniref:Uncharacterized protein n=1 Tax=Sphaerodactylus townsendi TaxID=933632 RepID=A0ACB8EM01_9SAUR
MFNCRSRPSGGHPIQEGQHRVSQTEHPTDSQLLETAPQLDPAEALPSRRGSGTSRRGSMRRPSELLETAPNCDPVEPIPSRRVSAASRRLMSVETGPQCIYTSMEIIHALYEWKYGCPRQDHINGVGTWLNESSQQNVLPSDHNNIKEPAAGDGAEDMEGHSHSFEWTVIYSDMDSKHIMTTFFSDKLELKFVF